MSDAKVMADLPCAECVRYENGRIIMLQIIQGLTEERDRYKLAAEMNLETIKDMQKALRGKRS